MLFSGEAATAKRGAVYATANTRLLWMPKVCNNLKRLAIQLHVTQAQLVELVISALSLLRAHRFFLGVKPEGQATGIKQAGEANIHPGDLIAFIGKHNAPWRGGFTCLGGGAQQQGGDNPDVTHVEDSFISCSGRSVA